MDSWYNKTGKPLSGDSWLQSHHYAKQPEREKFAQKICSFVPNIVADLGCGTGLWLEVLNELAPQHCEFIGIDSDESSLRLAKERAKSWNRKTTFIHSDLSNSQLNLLPRADMYLIFNVFSYIQNPTSLLNAIHARKLSENSKVIIRQYDGAALRFGPIETNLRMNIERELFSSLSGSNQIHHYDLDRVYKAAYNSNFSKVSFEFETFHRSSPFPKEFISYLTNMTEWTAEHVSDISKDKLKTWLFNATESPTKSPSYFIETDLVAELS